MNKVMYTLTVVINRNDYIDLVSFASLSDLDQYVQNNYTGEEDVKKQCLEMINKEKSSDDSRILNGKVVIYEKHYMNSKIVDIKKMNVIYQGFEMMSSNDAIMCLQNELNDDDFLKQLYLKKQHLFTMNELSLSRNYLKSNNLFIKKTFINSFISKIINTKDAKNYLRYLGDICNLIVKENEINMKK